MSQEELGERPRPPVRGLLKSLRGLWKNSRQGFILTMTRDIQEREGINPEKLLHHTSLVRFDNEFDDVLRSFGVENLDLPHNEPRMSAWEVTRASLGELNQRGESTLGGLESSKLLFYTLPHTSQAPYNWSTVLTPERMWQSMFEIETWTIRGLTNPNPLPFKDRYHLAAAAQFYAIAENRLGQAISSSAA